MQRKFSLAAALCVIALVLAAPAAALDNLNPGSAEANLDEAVPVNVVFVGYDFTAAQKAAFMAELPDPGTAAEPAYRVIERYPRFYDENALKPLGIDYTYQYNVVDAPDAFENALWAKLSELAKPESDTDGQNITLFQQQYNDQQKNVLDVVNNHFIDGPTVEQWLADNASFVDTTRNTVFFINWWGMGDTPRAGFKFHTYVKFGEPDPDTGYDFGRNRQSRKTIAWGGTPIKAADGDEETGLSSTRRIWFHDLSAGPESWTENWLVDGGDADGDGTDDYIMPAVWEYLKAGGLGARENRNLASDLGMVTRYVAINLMFTPSPLYSPNLTFPRQPRSIDLDLNTFEGWNGVDASTLFQDLPFLMDEEKEIVPTIISAENQDLPFVGDSLRCYQQFVSDHLCYSDRAPYGPGGGANLFLWAAQNRALWSDGDAEYEAPGFNWAVQQAPKAAGPLGFADDNWIDGTQSGIFNFIDPTIVSLGYGLTTTEIHEYGHHFAMSHTHDGFDWQTMTDYGPEGDTLWTWAGDESNSIMSYIDLNWDFSQFDRDNMHRYQAAAYWRSSNEIARLAQQKGLNLGTAPNTADTALGLARLFVAQHNYPGTHLVAWIAYEVLRQAYEATGNAVPASQHGWELSARQKRGKGHVFVPRYVTDHSVGAGTHRGQP